MRNKIYHELIPKLKEAGLVPQKCRSVFLGEETKGPQKLFYECGDEEGRQELDLPETQKIAATIEGV